ncbi:hypothetical protein [Paenibacillus assamensis]|uniref:hypothetical protein n=1 Tax=Paenibacillus assamensis TaxID=311244 RepID=UPI0004920247|nr:hypothetical protein [Paenibacillus assamensis]
MKLKLKHLRKDEFAEANIRLVCSKLVGEEIKDVDLTNKTLGVVVFTKKLTISVLNLKKHLLMHLLAHAVHGQLTK